MLAVGWFGCGLLGSTAVVTVAISCRNLVPQPPGFGLFSGSDCRCALLELVHGSQHLHCRGGRGGYPQRPLCMSAHFYSKRALKALRLACAVALLVPLREGAGRRTKLR